MSLDSILTSAANMLGSSIKSAVLPTTAGTTTMPADLSGSNNVSALLKSRSLLPEYACFVVCADRGIYVTAALPENFSLSAVSEYERPFADMLPNKASALGAIPKLIGLQPLVQALTARFWAGSSTGSIRIPLILQAQNNEVEEVLKPFADLMMLNLPSAPNGLGSILRSPGPSFSVTKAVQAANTLTSSVAKGVSSTDFKGLASDLWSAATGKSKLTDEKTVKGAIDSVETATSNAFKTLDSAIKNKISIQLGRYMIFDNVVIKNVTSIHKVQPVGGLYGQSTGNMQRVEVELEFEPFFDMTIESLLAVFLDSGLREYMAAQLAGSNKPQG